jgi:hypothetical protein
MRIATLTLAILCLGLCAVAQDASSSAASQDRARKSKDQITATGCVSKQNTDYILTQANRGNSYELQGSRNIRLKSYLGQRVEVTGTQAPSMSTSSDYLARSGSASPVTITVTSVKTIAKTCTY